MSRKCQNISSPATYTFETSLVVRGFRGIIPLLFGTFP